MRERTGDEEVRKAFLRGKVLNSRAIHQEVSRRVPTVAARARARVK
jgi:hypothetical protein